MSNALTIEEVRAQMTGDIRVVSEPLTYNPGGPSYFRDLIASTKGQRVAQERMTKHAAEMRVELPKRQRPIGDFKYEKRANPSRTEGQGGEFAPPLWLIDYFAPSRRAERVISRLMPNFELPLGVSSVNLPRITQGTEVAQDADNSAVPGRDIETAKVSSPAVAFSGQSDWSLQAFEQSPLNAPLDFEVFKECLQDYDASLESMIVAGSGEGESFKGVLKVANTVEFTEATPKATKLFTFLGQAMAQVGNKRKRPPEGWFMTTSRAAWLSTSEDVSERPLLLTDGVGESFPWGSLALIDLYFNDSIPTSLGVSKEQDAILIGRPSDAMLLESDMRTRVLLEPLSGTLGARFQVHGYAACLFRYPSAAWAAIQGTGMKVQTGF